MEIKNSKIPTGLMPATSKNFLDLMEYHELEESLGKNYGIKNVPEFIRKNYTAARIDGTVVYYIR